MRWLICAALMLCLYTPAQSMQARQQKKSETFSEKARQTAKSVAKSGYVWAAVIGLSVGLYIKYLTYDLRIQNAQIERDNALHRLDQAQEQLRQEKDEREQFAKRLDQLEKTFEQTQSIVAHFEHAAAGAVAEHGTKEQEFEARVTQWFAKRQEAIDKTIQEREAFDRQTREDIKKILETNQALKKSNIRARLYMNLLKGDIASMYAQLKKIAQRKQAPPAANG